MCDNSTYVLNNNDPKVKYNRTLDGDALSKFEQNLSHNKLVNCVEQTEP